MVCPLNGDTAEIRRFGRMRRTVLGNGTTICSVSVALIISNVRRKCGLMILYKNDL